MIPRPLQEEASLRMVDKKKCILQAACGFGKTITSLIAYKKIQHKLSFVIIIAPAGVVPKFISTAGSIGLDMTKVHTSSWSAIPNKYEEFFNLMKTDRPFCVIVDESHRIKTFKQVQSRAVIKIAKKSSFLFLLTATVTQHRPLDLYQQIKLCGGHNYTIFQYRIKFCNGVILPGRTYMQTHGSSNLVELKSLLDSVSIKGINKRKVKIEFKRYKVSGHGLCKPSFEETAKYRIDAGLYKMSRFIRLIKQGVVKGKAIIFVHHKEVLSYLVKHLECPFIQGGMSSKEKEKTIKYFLDSKEEFLVLSITASGEGVDIPGVFKCHFVELTYSTKTDMQAYMRMVRDDNDIQIQVNFYMLDNEHNYFVQLTKEHYLAIGG